MIAAALLLAPIAAAQSAAPEILSRVSQTYAHLEAIHVVANEAGAIDYELAERSPKFRVSVRSRDGEGIALRDGRYLYKALPRERRWARTWAPVAEGGRDASGVAQAPDLYDVVAGRLVTKYVGLAQSLEGAEILREDSVDLKSGKTAVWVLRTGGRELWIDRKRYLVLRDVESGVHANAAVETRVSEIEINGEVAPSSFSFPRVRKWREAELLFLPEETPLSLVGLPAAGFELRNIDGASLRLSAFRGKVVVLDFWSTWCQPCRKELPEIDSLRREFAGSAQFLTIDDEDAGTVRKFMEKSRYGFEVLLDATLRVHSLYGVRGIPAVDHRRWGGRGT